MTVLVMVGIAVGTPSVHAQIPGPVSVTDAIPRGMSAETLQNSEPSIAVAPNDPRRVLVSAFAERPGSGGPEIKTDRESFFLSSSGGKQFDRVLNLPSADTTVSWAGGRQGAAYITRLYNRTGRDNPNTIQVLRSNQPSGRGSYGSLTSIRPAGAVPDQPWIVTEQAGKATRIYVGYNASAVAFARTARVDFSTSSGQQWLDINLDKANPTLGDGPAARLAVSGDTAYAAFERVDELVGKANPRGRPGDVVGDVVVVRDDHAGSLPNGQPNPDAFQSLKSGSAIGVAAASQVVIPYGFPDIPGTRLGPERLGSDLSLAVDPHHANQVYLAWDQVVGGEPNAFVSYSANSGQTWTLQFVEKNAALPALAVADNGTVGFLFTEASSSGGSRELLTRFLEIPANDFSTAPGHPPGGGSLSSVVLARFSTSDPAPLRGVEPYIGDYQSLTAVGDTFYGAFSASNDPKPADFPQGVTFQRYVKLADGTVLGTDGPFPLTQQGTLVSDARGDPLAGGGVSIDPFVFSAPAAVPEPSSLALMTGGAVWILWWVRRRRSGTRPIRSAWSRQSPKPGGTGESP